MGQPLFFCLRLVNGSLGGFTCEAWKVAKDFLWSSLEVLEQYGPGVIVEGLMAEFAALRGIHTPLACVNVLAWKSLMKIKTFFSLCTPF